MKSYLALLIFNIIGIITEYIEISKIGNYSTIPYFIPPLVGLISFILLIIITIIQRKTIFRNIQSIILGVIILLINIPELIFLYAVFIKKYE